MVPQPSAQNVAVATLSERDSLRVRVQSEFAEMPGLRLTLCQAARLFCLERAECERLLTALVEEGVLVLDGQWFCLARNGRRCA